MVASEALSHSPEVASCTHFHSVMHVGQEPNGGKTQWCIKPRLVLLASFAVAESCVHSRSARPPDLAARHIASIEIHKCWGDRVTINVDKRRASRATCTIFFPCLHFFFLHKAVRSCLKASYILGI